MNPQDNKSYKKLIKGAEMIMQKSRRRKGIVLIEAAVIAVSLLILNVSVQAEDMGKIHSGETKLGTIAVEGEIDIFTFDGEAGQAVFIDITADNSNLGPAIYLYRPNGTLELSLVGGDSATHLRIEEHLLQQTGVYTIALAASHGWGTSLTGAYGISLLLIPGNTSSSQDPDGGAIASGHTYNYTINPVADTDAFTFYGTAGQAIFIDITANNSNLGPAIYLYRPNRTLELSLVGGDSATHLRIESHQLEQTGVYTIVLAASLGWGTSLTGAYGISLLLIPGNTSSSQDPDGGAIASGYTYSYTINPVADTDAFIFYGTAGQAVFIDITADNSNLGTAFYLFRPNRTLELSLVGGDSATHLRIESYQLEQTGVYTIVLAASLGWGTSLTGAYGISLLLIPGATSSSQDLDGGDITSGHLSNYTINPVADTDAFTFYGTAGQAVIIDITANNSNLGPAIYLFRPNRTLELSLVGGDSVTHIRIESHQLEKTGVYTIVMATSLGWGTSGTGGYDLSFVKIPPTPSPGIYNPFPPNEVTLTNLSQSFNWDSVSGATGYDLYFGENVITPLEKIGNNLSSPGMPFPDLEGNTIYYWHVNAHTPSGIVKGTYWWFKTQSTNQPPNQPQKPTGPTTRVTGQQGTYWANGTDPDGDKIQYRFDWNASGSHAYSGWTSLVNSGTKLSKNHSWTVAGTYVVKVQSKDEHGVTSVWSTGLTVTVTAENHPPNQPKKPTGPTTRLTGQQGKYWANGTDPDNDKIQYRFDWNASGSHSYSGWTSLVNSGQKLSINHTWTVAGTYVVKVQSKDEHGATSVWSKGLNVTVTVTGENHPPNQPKTPTGPTALLTGEQGTYWANGTDPDGDKIQYRFDWNASGSHAYSGWTSLVNSGTKLSKNHSWTVAGTYVVKVQSRDEHGELSVWSNELTVSVYVNHPPNKPQTPTGPTALLTGEQGTYWANGTDPDGDHIQFRFDWNASGSHTYSTWTSLVNSGQKLSMVYSWTKAGTYIVKVQSRDEHGKTSVWSNGLTVIVST
jgi:hypothetical protein